MTKMFENNLCYHCRKHYLTYGHVKQMFTIIFSTAVNIISQTVTQKIKKKILVVVNIIRSTAMLKLQIWFIQVAVIIIRRN